MKPQQIKKWPTNETSSTNETSLKLLCKRCFICWVGFICWVLQMGAWKGNPLLLGCKQMKQMKLFHFHEFLFCLNTLMFLFPFQWFTKNVPYIPSISLHCSLHFIKPDLIQLRVLTFHQFLMSFISSTQLSLSGEYILAEVLWRALLGLFLHGVLVVDS